MPRSVVALSGNRSSSLFQAIASRPVNDDVIRFLFACATLSRSGNEPNLSSSQQVMKVHDSRKLFVSVEDSQCGNELSFHNFQRLRSGPVLAYRERTGGHQLFRLTFVYGGTLFQRPSEIPVGNDPQQLISRCHEGESQVPSADGGEDLPEASISVYLRNCLPVKHDVTHFEVQPFTETAGRVMSEEILFPKASPGHESDG